MKSPIRSWSVWALVGWGLVFLVALGAEIGQGGGGGDYGVAEVFAGSCVFVLICLPCTVVAGFLALSDAARAKRLVWTVVLFLVVLIGGAAMLYLVATVVNGVLPHAYISVVNRSTLSQILILAGLFAPLLISILALAYDITQRRAMFKRIMQGGDSQAA